MTPLPITRRGGPSRYWLGLHPNVEGHRVIAEYVIKNLLRARRLGGNSRGRCGRLGAPH
jgi:hypothetical protein